MIEYMGIWGKLDQMEFLHFAQGVLGKASVLLCLPFGIAW